MDKKDRSTEEDLEMLGLAHASRYHWGLVGSPENQVVGDWQLSRVYSDLKQPYLALLFAKSSLEACEANGLTDLKHTAYEAMARAHAVAKGYNLARTYLDKARRQLDTLKLNSEDREVYLEQLRQTEQLVPKQ